MQRAPQKELLAAQMAVKKRQWGCRTPLMNAGDGSPIQSATSHHYAQAAHRTADAPPDLSNCPTQSSGRAKELIRKRRSIVVRRNTDIPALGQYEERERGGSINVGAANVGAENVTSRQFTTFCCTHELPMNEESCAAFSGNIRCGAMDSTTVRQDAAVHVEMDRTPLDMMIRGYKNCGAMERT
ncbi:hypothetical protein TcYC6_0020060 [Trypanosoma cruzi]|nr:hypothetical protein TcYC6_0020060 [Trypanosoma cruzi]